MLNTLENIINHFSKPKLANTMKINCGLERECLRVDKLGNLSQKGHPNTLGKSLTNPFITTDYSESLLEFITPVCKTPEEVISFLQNIHTFTMSNLDNELLWPLSMPCDFDNEDLIAIAYFGTSNKGKMKQVYRQGLQNRYGGPMQIIAGIHYNFSLDNDFWLAFKGLKQSNLSLNEFKNVSYMSMARNVQRFAWLFTYLFGASPLFSKSYLGKNSCCEELLESFEGDNNTLIAPYATSLRMSGLGYQSSKQNSITISYNNLESYVNNLLSATHNQSLEFSKIGIQDNNGEYKQLNDHLLQIENEYYSLVRPKRVIQPCERPCHALSSRGIEYLELRFVDINPFEYVGISVEQIRFLDTFLLFCLFTDSPMHQDIGYQTCRENCRQVAIKGRMPGLTLINNGKEVKLSEWGNEIINQMLTVSSLLDSSNETKDYTSAVENQKKSILDPNQTLSGKLINRIKSSNTTLTDFALNKAMEQQTLMLDKKIPSKTEEILTKSVPESFEKQKSIEESDSIDFKEYLNKYFS